MQTAVSAPAAASSLPATRWNWLWSRRRDLLWTFLPFWLGYVLLTALFLTRDMGSSPTAPNWKFSGGGRMWDILGITMLLYGPLVDGPHLWATIARTYTDSNEWAQRRKLFLYSLGLFALGPGLILAPYIVNRFIALPETAFDLGWQTWTTVFTVYATFHIYKQHWGVVSLYKRKNADSDALDAKVDAWFFPLVMWLPWLMWLLAPWSDASPFPKLSTAATALGHTLFVSACVTYALFQLARARAGSARNGPKLLYMGTVAGLYYLTFAWHPRIAAFWVLITSTGHCIQYHGIVWAYGQKQYANEPSLPGKIFRNPALYIGLGILFALVTLQGPGSGAVTRALSSAMQFSLFAYAFPFLGAMAGVTLGAKICGALISGLRLHHFYVDSKIWRVSRQANVARNLGVN